MNQVDLLPSGIQQVTPNVIVSTPTLFCYASTLAIYVHALDKVGYPLLRVCSGPERAIRAISLLGGAALTSETSTSPESIMVVAVCEDGNVFLWDICDGKLICHVPLNNFKCESVASSPWKVNAAAGGKIFMGGFGLEAKIWDLQVGTVINQSFSSFGDDEENHCVECCRYSIQCPSLLAVGTSVGMFVLYDISRVQTIRRVDIFEEYKKLLKDPENSPMVKGGGWVDDDSSGSLRGAVVDVEFDPLGPNYVLLVLLSFPQAHGYMLLYDVTSYQIVQVFDKCLTGVRKVAWIPNQPGNFLSIDGKTNALRLWNVSTRACLTSFRPKNVSLRALALIPPNYNRVILGAANGEVLIWDMHLKRIDFNPICAHSETIFETKFSYHERDLMASCSFDQTVKIWDLKTMKNQKSLSIGAIVYSLDWSPCGSNIAVSMATGEVANYNIKTGRAIFRTKVHSDFAWKVKFNEKEPRLIASSSKDCGVCVLIATDGSMPLRYVHPAPAFGLSWCKVVPTMLATGCHDNRVRIFNCAEQSMEPWYVLQAHEDAIYNVEWNPLLPNVLASGSNDKVIRIWTFPLQQSARNESLGEPCHFGITKPTDAALRSTSKDSSHHPSQQFLSATLIGHSNKVRALCWCTCAPYLLLSGSWDGTIRIWDIRKAACVSVIHHHTSDVYSLSTHPDRPLIFVSGSRDTTVRFWSLTLLAHLYMNAATGMLHKSIVASPNEAMGFHAETPGGFPDVASGEPIQRLQAQLCNSGMNALERLKIISDFFDFPHGVKDLVCCLYHYFGEKEVILGEEGEDVEVEVAPIDILSARAKRKADQLGKVKDQVAASVGSSHRETKLIAAAEAYLHLGDVKTFCELLLEAGETDRALASAPLVGMNYWRHLSLKVGDKLAAAGDSKCVQYYICACEAHRAADFLASRKEYVEAMMIVQQCAQSRTENCQGTGLDQSMNPSLVDPRVNAEKLSAFASQWSAQYASSGNPNLAAAALLSSRCFRPVLSTLVKGNSIALAQLLLHVLAERPMHVGSDPELLADMDAAYEASMCHCVQVHQFYTAMFCASRHPSDPFLMVGKVLCLLETWPGAITAGTWPGSNPISNQSSPHTMTSRENLLSYILSHQFRPELNQFLSLSSSSSSLSLQQLLEQRKLPISGLKELLVRNAVLRTSSLAMEQNSILWMTFFEKNVIFASSSSTTTPGITSTNDVGFTKELLQLRSLLDIVWSINPMSSSTQEEGTTTAAGKFCFVFDEKMVIEAYYLGLLLVTSTSASSPAPCFPQPSYRLIIGKKLAEVIFEKIKAIDERKKLNSQSGGVQVGSLPIPCLMDPAIETIGKKAQEILGNITRELQIVATQQQNSQIQEGMNKQQLLVVDLPPQLTPLGGHLPVKQSDGLRALSCISGKEITGTMFTFEDGSSYASQAEARAWLECCPFSPLKTGFRFLPF